MANGEWRVVASCYSDVPGEWVGHEPPERGEVAWGCPVGRTRSRLPFAIRGRHAHL